MAFLQEFGLTPFGWIPSRYPGARPLQKSSYSFRAVPLQFQRFAFPMYRRRGSPTIARRPKFYPPPRVDPFSETLRRLCSFSRVSYYLYIPLAKWSYPAWSWQITRVHVLYFLIPVSWWWLTFSRPRDNFREVVFIVEICEESISSLFQFSSRKKSRYDPTSRKLHTLLFKRFHSMFIKSSYVFLIVNYIIKMYLKISFCTLREKFF